MAIRSIALVLAVTMLPAASAEAMGALRCDGRLIDRGVSAAYVLMSCGEPELSVSYSGAARGAVPGGFTRLSGLYFSEIWIYDRGVGAFPAELHFRDGILRRIGYQPRRAERGADPETAE